MTADNDLSVTENTGLDVSAALRFGIFDPEGFIGEAATKLAMKPEGVWRGGRKDRFVATFING